MTHHAAKSVAIILVCLLLAAPSLAAESIRLVSPDSQAVAQGRIAIRPDPAALEQLFQAGGARVVGFPLPGGELIDLDIASFDPVGPQTRFLVATADGAKETTGPAIRFFRGEVAGDSDSLVSLNLFDGRIGGFVRWGKREYSFGPRAFAVGSEGWDEIQVVDDALETSSSAQCDGNDEAGFTGEAPDSPVTQAIGSGTLLVGKVAIEGTVEWVTRMGGVSAAQIYTLNLLAQVSAIYESEVRVQLQVPYILMNAAEPDGYSGASNSTATVLAEMRTKWNGDAALRGVARSAVHLFSTYPSGGAGRAYIDVLCGNVPANTNAYDYGVSLMDGNGGSWERRMVAHELGHNFSSRHSHCYAPELDQCNNTETGCYAGTVVQSTGTIMSYCNTRLSTFHQRERDERIRPGAERAYPSCMEVAGSPGMAGEVAVGLPGGCPSADLQNDDGAGNGMYGYSGALRATWVKRFTPSCLPFKITGIDVRIAHASVAVGRPVRLLVYTDPTGSGSIANASLVRTQNATVQVVSSTVWNQYALTSPVLLDSGDYYIGFEDLVADTVTNYIMDYDARPAADSFYTPDSTDPAAFGPFPGGTGSWMIRGHGAGLSPGSVRLSWDPPCNDATVPGQDFAVYQGSVGSWAGYTSLTCTTGHARSWLIESPPPGSFWIIVPQNSVAEGSYGQSSAGERPPAAAACRPQTIGVCQ